MIQEDNESETAVIIRGRTWTVYLQTIEYNKKTPTQLRLCSILWNKFKCRHVAIRVALIVRRPKHQI